MKIKQKIKNYLNDEDGPLTNQQIEVLKKYGGWVAGGAISCLASGREIRDIDVYVPNIEAAIALVETTFPLSMSDKAIMCTPRGKDIPPLQIIYNKYYKKPTEIFKNFDFTACMGAYSFKDDKVTFGEDFVSANMERELRFNAGTLYPIMSMFRVEKYKEYGYTISQFEMLKVLTTVGRLNLQSLADLQEQIGGFYDEQMKLNFVDSLDSFMVAEPYVLSTEKKLGDVNSDDIIEALLNKQYGDLLKGKVFKAVLHEEHVPGHYTSILAPRGREIEYKIGDTIDTRLLAGNKCIYGSKIHESLISHKGGDIIELTEIETFPSTKEGFFSSKQERFGKYLVRRRVCSAAEWEVKSVLDRVRLIQELDDGESGGASVYRSVEGCDSVSVNGVL